MRRVALASTVAAVILITVGLIWHFSLARHDDEDDERPPDLSNGPELFANTRPPPVEDARDQAEAIEMAVKVDIPSLAYANRVEIMELLPGTSSFLPPITINQLDAMKELRQALKPGDVSEPKEGVGTTRYALVFYRDHELVRSIWIFQNGEWGFNSRRVSWTIGTERSVLETVERQLKARTDRHNAIRDSYEKRALTPLKLVEPVEVQETFYYKDGGSIGIILRDAKGAEHKFCFDGRKPGESPLFLDAVHPSRDGAKKVALRGPEESALYGIMLRWVKRHPMREALFDENNKLSDANDMTWEARAFFLRLDRRFTQ